MIRASAGRTAWRTGWAVSLVLVLSACASLRPPTGLPESTALSGRLAVQVAALQDQPARSMSAAFELRGSAESGELDLVSPLGTLIGRARWTPDEAVLITSQGEQRFARMDALTQQLVGETLPIDALFDWLQGRPWPGAESIQLPAPLVGFAQRGWQIDLARQSEGFIVARRDDAPAVTVRAKLDTP